MARLAYELSLRALDQQEASLRELRSRTGTLLAASSLTASFLGAPALEGGLTAPALLALVAFGGVVVLSLTVLVPRPGLVFAVDGATVHAALQPCDEDEALHRVAHWLGIHLRRERAARRRPLATVRMGMRRAGGAARPADVRHGGTMTGMASQDHPQPAPFPPVPPLPPGIGITETGERWPPEPVPVDSLRLPMSKRGPAR